MPKTDLQEIKAWLQEKMQEMNVWLRPDPADAWPLQAVKLLLKSIVVLVLLALSPVLLVVLLFVFFAAL